MLRWTALLVVLALTATSASRLACLWECGEVPGDSQTTTACHDLPASGSTVTASKSHCPLTPDAAALWTAKGNEPQRLRPTLDEVWTPDPLAGPATAASFHPPGSPAPRHSPGAVFQSRPVLRV